MVTEDMVETGAMVVDAVVVVMEETVVMGVEIVAMAAVKGAMEVVATQTGVEDTLEEEGEDTETTGLFLFYSAYMCWKFKV